MRTPVCRAPSRSASVLPSGVFLLLWLGLTVLPAAAQDLTVTLQWATKGEEGGILFGTISGMAAGADGAVIIADDVNSALLTLDPLTGRVRTAARDGSGPGEVETPTLLAPHGDTAIALYDIGHAAVQIYRRDMTPISRIQIGRLITNPKGLAVLVDGSFVISGGMFRSEYAVHWFAPDGRLRQSWTHSPESLGPSARLQTAGGPVWPLAGGGFLYSNSAPHRILRFADPASREPQQVAADSILLPAMTDDTWCAEEIVAGRRACSPRWYYDQSRAIFPLTGGRLLNVITRVYRGDSVWELWDDQGNLLVRKTVTVPYRPWGRVDEDHVLVSFRDVDTDEAVAGMVQIRITR
jgi:hypothetical protein